MFFFASREDRQKTVKCCLPRVVVLCARCSSPHHSHATAKNSSAATDMQWWVQAARLAPVAEGTSSGRGDLPPGLEQHPRCRKCASDSFGNGPTGMHQVCVSLAANKRKPAWIGDWCPPHKSSRHALRKSKGCVRMYLHGATGVDQGEASQERFCVRIFSTSNILHAGLFVLT